VEHECLAPRIRQNYLVAGLVTEKLPTGVYGFTVLANVALEGLQRQADRASPVLYVLAAVDSLERRRWGEEAADTAVVGVLQVAALLLDIGQLAEFMREPSACLDRVAVGVVRFVRGPH
jgi:hypothetical protein